MDSPRSGVGNGERRVRRDLPLNVEVPLHHVIPFGIAVRVLPPTRVGCGNARRSRTLARNKRTLYERTIRLVATVTGLAQPLAFVQVDFGS